MTALGWGPGPWFMSCGGSNQWSGALHIEVEPAVLLGAVAVASTESSVVSSRVVGPLIGHHHRPEDVCLVGRI